MTAIGHYPRAILSRSASITANRNSSALHVHSWVQDHFGQPTTMGVMLSWAGGPRTSAHHPKQLFRRRTILAEVRRSRPGSSCPPHSERRRRLHPKPAHLRGKELQLLQRPPQRGLFRVTIDVAHELGRRE